jgi:cell division protein FtsW
MMLRPQGHGASIDAGLMWSVLVLFALGLVMVYSASIATAEMARSSGFRSTYYLSRHGLFLGVGALLGILAFQVPVALWQRAAPWLFAVGLGLLILVLIPGVGRDVNGSRRWISVGLGTFQPSELMKLFVVLYAADYTVRKAAFMHDLKRGFLPMFGVMTAVAFLLLREPDFGALVVVTSITMAVLFLGGLNWRLFVALVVFLAMAFAVLVFTSPYRLKRLVGFMDPWTTALKEGYQLSHALIAFGRGEWLGVGLGASVEKLFYLPEAHTDFILAVIGEELGFIGVALIIALFAYIIVRAFAIGRLAATLECTFAALTAYGIGVWLAVQAFINMGVNLGILPTKGLTLPFLSSGGTGVVVTCLAVAVLMRIDHENRVLTGGRVR